MRKSQKPGYNMLARILAGRSPFDVPAVVIETLGTQTREQNDEITIGMLQLVDDVFAARSENAGLNLVELARTYLNFLVDFYVALPPRKTVSGLEEADFRVYVGTKRFIGARLISLHADLKDVGSLPWTLEHEIFRALLSMMYPQPSDGPTEGLTDAELKMRGRFVSIMEREGIMGRFAEVIGNDAEALESLILDLNGAAFTLDFLNELARLRQAARPINIIEDVRRKDFFDGLLIDDPSAALADLEQLESKMRHSLAETIGLYLTFGRAFAHLKTALRRVDGVAVSREWDLHARTLNIVVMSRKEQHKDEAMSHYTQHETMISVARTAYPVLQLFAIRLELTDHSAPSTTIAAFDWPADG